MLFDPFRRRRAEVSWEQVIADTETLEKDAIQAETDAQKGYEAFVKDTNKSALRALLEHFGSASGDSRAFGSVSGVSRAVVLRVFPGRFGSGSGVSRTVKFVEFKFRVFRGRLIVFQAFLGK